MFTDFPMFVNDGESASTSRMWQFGHAADTACTSSAISTPHPGSGRGGEAPPRWLTFRKQPFADVQDGSPHAARYAARSASTFGLSNASTIAIVCPTPRVTSSW